MADTDAILRAELAGEDPLPVVGPRPWGTGKPRNNMPRTTPKKKSSRASIATNPTVDARFTARDVFLRGPWQELLAAVSTGETAKGAMLRLGIERGMVAGITESIPTAKEAWVQAQRQWWRVRWPAEVVEDIMVDIAAGEIIKDAVEKRGMPVHEFYHLALKDAEIKQMYDDAQQIRLESMAEKIVAVSDDAEGDYNEYGRLNSENINRAKLKVDTRKWIMSRIGWKRFGDRLQTEQNVNIVVDHAARLDAARKRVEGMRDVPVLEAIDPTLVAVQ